MALITCPECKSQISDLADACPKCGYKLTEEIVQKIKEETEKKKISDAKSQLWSLLIAFAFFGALVFGCVMCISNTTHTTPEKSKTSAEIRKDQLQVGFSRWDGSHKELSELIKSNMNDPKSFEHVDTFYSDRGNFLIVTVKYRGKNKFGGVVQQWIKARCSIDGRVLEVIDQG